MTSNTAVTRTITTRTQGRYLVEIPSTPGSHPVLVGFHGYGENAELHLDELNRIPGAAAWIRVSVQGLHWFYNSRHERVIASWMTKLGREQAIDDNIGYVRSVCSKLREEFRAASPLVYVGFSQGAAMAYRAAAYAGHPCQGLIILGGDLPPEIRADTTVKLPPVLLGRGRREQWYTEQKCSADIEALTRRDVPVELCLFEGGHEWTDEFRRAAERFLGQRRGHLFGRTIS